MVGHLQRLSTSVPSRSLDFPQLPTSPDFRRMAFADAQFPKFPFRRRGASFARGFALGARPCAFRRTWAASSLSVVIYPTVIATTRRAPMSFGGLGTGTSNQRQNTPIGSRPYCGSSLREVSAACNRAASSESAMRISCSRQSIATLNARDNSPRSRHRTIEFSNGSVTSCGSKSIPRPCAVGSSWRRQASASVWSRTPLTMYSACHNLRLAIELLA